MQYVLGVALEYKKYKKFARVKIFANEHLIDDLTLDEDIDTKTVSYGKIEVGPNFKTEPYSAEIPKKIFIYEVDESVLKNNIRIEVENDDTNYNNGFMTKWSYISLHKVFLIPKNYLDFEKLDQLTVKNNSILADTVIPDPPWRLHWPAIQHKIENRNLVYSIERDKLGGSFSVKYPIMLYKQNSIGTTFRILAPGGWGSLLKINERLIVISDWLPIYCQAFGLINTVNENQ